MGLLDKLSSVGKKATTLGDSEVYFDRDLIDTGFISPNIAFSGEVDGGIGSGVTVLAGPSKHFKSNTGLLAVAAYLKKYSDAICIFYDSEFGAPPDYWTNFGIDISRILHVPIENLEELKFDLPQKLQEIKRGDKVIIFVDSVGNLASKKEASDAVDGKSTTDMTRSREMKSLFRIVTPMIKLRNIPAIFIAHTYQCGTENMLVKTPNGNISLKDLSVGDEVYTSNGIEKVLFTTSHEEAYVVDIELENGEILSFTDQHRFKVNGKWKYVCDINIGDDLEVA